VEYSVENTETDEALAERLQKGDKSVFVFFMQRYETKLLRYGRKFLPRTEDIQDIVQEVFLSAYVNIRSFDTDQKFSPWMYRIAHNAFVNELKKNVRNPLLLIDFDTFLSHIAYNDPDETERERADMRVLIDKGLEEISPKYREVLILHYLDELGYQEIADVLRVPVSTIGVRLKRGREALRAAYEKIDQSHGKQ
jgi:RNA polymerase sigma-70 factor (ECF subfamily)